MVATNKTKYLKCLKYDGEQIASIMCYNDIEQLLLAHNIEPFYLLCAGLDHDYYYNSLGK